MKVEKEIIYIVDDGSRFSSFISSSFLRVVNWFIVPEGNVLLIFPLEFKKELIKVLKSNRIDFQWHGKKSLSYYYGNCIHYIQFRSLPILTRRWSRKR
jgi:hypothetical protein